MRVQYQIQKQLIWAQHKEAERRRRCEEEMLAESREVTRVVSGPNSRISKLRLEEEFRFAPQRSSAGQPGLRGMQAENVFQLASKLGRNVPFLSKKKGADTLKGVFSTLGPPEHGGTCV